MTVVPRCGAVDGLDGELAIGGGLPAHAAAGGLTGLARQHLDAIGHDEGGIEAHAELADELRILLRIAR